MHERAITADGAVFVEFGDSELERMNDGENVYVETPSGDVLQFYYAGRPTDEGVDATPRYSNSTVMRLDRGRRAVWDTLTGIEETVVASAPDAPRRERREDARLWDHS